MNRVGYVYALEVTEAKPLGYHLVIADWFNTRQLLLLLLRQ